MAYSQCRQQPLCLVRLVHMVLLVLLVPLGEMAEMGGMVRMPLGTMTICRAAIEGEPEFAANQLAAYISPAPLALLEDHLWERQQLYH